MKMAKASAQDLEVAMELCGAMEALTSRWSPYMPEKIAKDDEGEMYDPDDEEQNKRIVDYLRGLAGRASLMRVVYGCAVMLDPANRCVNHSADTIEHHPDIQELEAAKILHPLEEYHEDNGAVLWWKLPINEPPYCGSPLCDDWPRYHTHWTVLICPTCKGSGDAP